MECVCSRHFFSNLVEFVDLSNLRGATACGLVYKFFRINNIELIEKMFVCPVPKISQFKMKRGRRASHLGRFTLSGTTVAELLHHSVVLFCGRTAAELLHHSVDLLCGTTTAELLHNSLGDLLCGTTATEVLFRH